MRKSIGAVVVAFVCYACIGSRSSEKFVESPPLTDLYPNDNSTNLLDSACPTDQVHIIGEYCPQVEEVCLHWVDAKGRPAKDPAPGESGRCGEFQYPSRCLSSIRVHKDFCIDRYEAGVSLGQVPPSWISYYDAERILKEKGKRICGQSEWTMACEGLDIQPYPYGDGYHRDRTACNFDNPVPAGLDVFKATGHNTESARKLDGMLRPAGSMMKCVSPFGVADQVGNLDEWVVNESGVGYRSGLMGGHVFGVRSRCRAITEGHGPSFSWYETTYRGCSDPKK